jgi:phage repressor protein C with HTH and peptisase S24 domain
MSSVGSSGTLLAVIDDDRTGKLPPTPSTAWLLARVTGPSMSPTVRSGERLLVRRRTPDAVRPGDVVLARFPSRSDLLVVKRVRRAVDGGHWVEGDNPFVTDDSRAYGAAIVVGRVVARVWPRPGRLPPPPRD